MTRVVVGVGGRQRNAVVDAADVVRAEDLGRAMQGVPPQPDGDDRRGDRPTDDQIGQQGRRGRTQKLAGENPSQRGRIDRPRPPGDRRRQGGDHQEQKISCRANDKPGPARRVGAVDQRHPKGSVSQQGEQ